MKTLRKIIPILVLFVLLSPACAVINKSQLEAVKALAGGSDSVSVAPSVLLGSLADIRKTRGIFYATSMDSPELKASELEAVAKAAMADDKLAARADNCTKVLRSYARALQSLSSDTRYKSAGTEIRSLGRSVDSLFAAWDLMTEAGWTGQHDKANLTGYGKQSGNYAAMLAEIIIRHSQRASLKRLIISSDTLIANVCDALVATIKSTELTELIKHEKESLHSDYVAYIQASQRNGAGFSAYESDVRYVELSTQLAEAEALRTRVANSFKSLAKAHHSLALSFDNPKKTTEALEPVWEEILTFLEQTHNLARYFAQKPGE